MPIRTPITQQQARMFQGRTATQEILSPTATPAAVPDPSMVSPLTSPVQTATQEILSGPTLMPPAGAGPTPQVQTATQEILQPTAAGATGTQPQTDVPTTPETETPTPGTQADTPEAFLQFVQQTFPDTDPGMYRPGTESVMGPDGTQVALNYVDYGNKDRPFRLYMPPSNLPADQKALWEADNQKIIALHTAYDKAVAGVPGLASRAWRNAYYNQHVKPQMDAINSKWKTQIPLIMQLANTPAPGEFVNPQVDIPEPGGEGAGTPEEEAARDAAGDIITDTAQPGEGPAQEAVGEQGAPPETTTTPIKEGELSKTAQEKLDAFMQTSPADHPGGLEGWAKERDALRKAASDEAKTNEVPTTGGVTTPEQEAAIGDYIEQDPGLQSFLTDMISRAGTISPEEESEIRRKYAQATSRALSGLSSRGLGRGSEAAGVIGQGEYAAEAEIGAAKREARTKGIDQALEASRQITQATEGNRNYQLATRGASLDELKNAQDVSFRTRAEQLKNMETKAAIKAMEKEFGLKIDEFNWNKWKEGAELDLSAIDMDETNRLTAQNQAFNFIAQMRDSDIQEKLGLTRLEVEQWIAGENINVERESNAITKILGLMGIQVDREKIQAQLAIAQSELAGGEKSAWSQAAEFAIRALPFIL